MSGRCPECEAHFEDYFCCPHCQEELIPDFDPTALTVDLTIDQVSQIIGVSKTRLRYWEKAFEVPVKRTPTNRRLYSEPIIARLQRIKDLHDQGYAALGIKRNLEKRTP